MARNFGDRLHVSTGLGAKNCNGPTGEIEVSPAVRSSPHCGAARRARQADRLCPSEWKGARRPAGVVCGCASVKFPQAEPNADQAGRRKWAWIVLDSFVRFGAFQRLTGTPNQNGNSQGAQCSRDPLPPCPPRERGDPGSWRGRVSRIRALDGAHLQGASLIEAELQGASLVHAQAQVSNFASAQLHGAALDFAQLQGASFFSAELPGVSATQASLEVALLEKAQLQGAFLPRADLSGATLTRADFSGASLRLAALFFVARC